MCRNITTLRGLQPPPSTAEIEAAALQYVRKVAGIARVPTSSDAAVNTAVAQIASATAQLLEALPPRRTPPSKVPPLRRRVVGQTTSSA